MGYPVFGIARMYDHAAIGARRIFKIQVQDEIIVGFFTPDRFIFISGQYSVCNGPNSFGENGVGKSLIEEWCPSSAGGLRIDESGVLCGPLQGPAGKEEETE